MYESILVPVDGSEYAQKALKVASQLATSSSAVIYVLNVPQIPPATDPLGIAVGAPSLDFSDDEVEAAGQKLVENLQEAEKEGHGLIDRIKSAVGLDHVEMKPIVRMGQPAEVILEEASSLGVEAIVMGSRGMSDLKSLAVGSVSHKVMHVAPCTVITVH